MPIKGIKNEKHLSYLHQQLCCQAPSPQVREGARVHIGDIQLGVGHGGAEKMENYDCVHCVKCQKHQKIVVE